MDTTIDYSGGTTPWMSPELFVGGAKVSKEADMYAFGMVVYEVITGAHPYRSARELELEESTIVAFQNFKPSIPKAPVPAGVGEGTWELVKRCWDEIPTLRPSARAALDHFERIAGTSVVADQSPAMRIQEGNSKSFGKRRSRGTASSL